MSTTSKVDFFLHPDILKKGKTDPRVRKFFGDEKIKNIVECKKQNLQHKKDLKSLQKIHITKL